MKSIADKVAACAALMGTGKLTGAQESLLSNANRQANKHQGRVVLTEAQKTEIHWLYQKYFRGR